MFKIFGKKKIKEDVVANIFVNSILNTIDNGFPEIVGIINYKYKRIFTQIKVNQIKYKFHGNSVFISENTLPLPIIYIPHFDNDISVLTIQAHLGFLINPKNNMSILVGINKRTWEHGTIHETNYVYFGFRTSLRNLYDDF